MTADGDFRKLPAIYLPDLGQKRDRFHGDISFQPPITSYLDRS
jgi:hypothetical protein